MDSTLTARSTHSHSEHTAVAESAGTSQNPEQFPLPEAGPGVGNELRARFRYRLIKRLGNGAFASVFFARCLDHDPRRDDSPPPRVAIKVLAASRQNAAELLRRELAAMLAMRHQHIPRVYDWSLEKGHIFVVMQYFRAGNLRDVIPSEGQVAEESVWKMLSDMLGALDAAHRASVLHLDIKPANVLLDGLGGFVLTDFGVSQASRMARGLLPFSVGTRGYQAPEQLNERFEQYDLRTDLWGLGATAWAFATGIHLAHRKELLDLEKKSGAGLPPLSAYRPGVSPELEDVVMRLLQVNPSDRPGSVAEVLARVTAARAGGNTAPLAFSSDRRSNLSDEEVEELIDSLVDPLLISICRNRAFRNFFVRFDDSEVLCTEGEGLSYAFLLLRGSIVVSRERRELARVEREGSILGEVGTLSGIERRATLRAAGPVWAIVLNEAELERFLTTNPAMALRVIRSMAHRLANAPGSRRQSEAQISKRAHS